VFTGIGVTATVQPGATSKRLPVIINIAQDATAGQRHFSINTPTGSAHLFTGFTVISNK
jgi:hypothetical protein